MSDFFECNLERTQNHLFWGIQEEYTQTVDRIYRRTEKLNTALDMVRMKPETFQKITAELFHREEVNYGTVEHFDSMEPDELARYAEFAFENLECGHDVEYDRFDGFNAVVLFDAAYATVKEWELLRHIGIGGSDDSVISGVTDKRTLLGLYYDKVGFPRKTDEGSKLACARGHFLENNVIEEFCSLTGATPVPETRMFRNKKYPHCIADIDSIIRMPDGTYRIFEAKTSRADNREYWRGNLIPPYYLTQCRHYLSVLDYHEDSETEEDTSGKPLLDGINIGCLFVVDWDLCGRYIGSQFNDDMFISHFVERNYPAENEQMEQIEEFWENYVEPGIEPPVDRNIEVAIAETCSVISNADPNLPVKEMTTAENARKIKRMLELKDKIESIKKLEIQPLETEYNKYKEEFIKLLGPVTDGVVEIGNNRVCEVCFRPMKKTETDLKLLQLLSPEIFGKVVTVKPEATRVFKLKEKEKKKA